jgi:uncharacterized protein
MDMNVSQLLRDPVGSTREFHVDEVADVVGDGQQNRVTGDCRLMRTHSSVLVSCRLNTEVELTCSRCLGRFRQPLKIRFEEEFLPTLDVLSGMPLPPPEDSAAFTIDEHHILDIAEAVRQYALLALPIKPLCKIKCAGLCPTCGKNLNEGQCACPGPGADPRWDKLAELN